MPRFKSQHVYDSINIRALKWIISNAHSEQFNDKVICCVSRIDVNLVIGALHPVYRRMPLAQGAIILK